MRPKFFRSQLSRLLPLACSALFVAPLCAAGVQTADPDANQSAKQLLAYIASVPSRPSHRIISGQAIGRPGGYGTNDMLNGYKHLVDQLHDQTGQWVGLIGASYGQRSTRQKPPYIEADQLLADYWKAGGLVTIVWLPANPWTGGNQSDANGVGPFNELLTPGTPPYVAWHAELDELALDLEELQKAGVVVLFRAFPEQNGSWFWWGAQRGKLTKDQFSSLWRSAFDYLTRTKGLHNLLWVFATSARAPIDPLALYPGSDVVDIVGVDDYEQSEPNIPSYRELLSLGKPIALTEFGPDEKTAKSNPHNFDFTTLRDALQHKYDKFAYFMAWSGADDRPQALLENRNAAALLNDPWVANRKDIAGRQ
jgi:mannan endo-1,4-beta-mannosidase